MYSKFPGVELNWPEPQYNQGRAGQERRDGNMERMGGELRVGKKREIRAEVSKGR